MDWHELATEMANIGYNAGEITRELQKTGQFSGESFYQAYERVRKYVRKHKKPMFSAIQQFVPNTTDSDWNGEQTITFGLIGDTHIGSKWTQLTHLNTFYDICEKRGVKTVYHTGDISEGDQMRVGHEYEVYTHGADDFIKHIVSAYPKRNGVVTKFITGNHDASIYKHSGCDIGTYISAMRDDMIYLGRDIARVNLTDKCTLELRHPWDGSAYAISQKSQKIIDNMEDKPAILAIGHYHKDEMIYYRGVYSFQTACFQARTPFEVGKNIIPVVGGWIITVHVTKDGEITSITPEFIPFNRELQDDYKKFI